MVSAIVGPTVTGSRKSAVPVGRGLAIPRFPAARSGRSVQLGAGPVGADDDGDVLVTVWVVHQVLQPGRQGEHLCSEAGAVLASWVLQLLLLLLLPVRPDTRAPDTPLVVSPSMEPFVQSHMAHCRRG